MQNRKHWIDLAKGLAMIFIVFSHTGSGSLIDTFYLPFFLNLFFFISGYLFKKDLEIIDEVKYLSCRLFLPMLFLGTINSVIAYFVEGDNLLRRSIDLILQMSSVNNDMWFIACLICCHFVFFLVFKMLRNQSLWSIGICLCLGILASYVLTFSQIVLPFRLIRSFTYLFFFSIGVMYKEYENRMETILSKWSTFFLIIILYVLVFAQYGSSEFYCSLGDVGIGTIGVIALVIISKKIENCAWIEYIGRNTLVYYAFQSKAIKAIVMIMSMIGVKGSSISVRVLVTIFAIVILAIPSEIIRKWFPFLIGNGKCRNNSNITKQDT